MALGRHLVDELQLERTDTLGKWMAHHVAELLAKAEHSSDQIEREAATNQVVEVILKIWEHRRTVDRVNPFRELGPVVRVLDALSAESPPWRIQQLSGGLGSAAYPVYDLLRRITICFVLLELDDLRSARKGLARVAKTRQWLSDEEKRIAEALGRWLEPSYFQTTKTTGGRHRSPKGQGEPTDGPDLRETASVILGQLAEALPRLDARLHGEGDLGLSGRGTNTD